MYCHVGGKQVNVTGRPPTKKDCLNVYCIEVRKLRNE